MVFGLTVQKVRDLAYETAQKNNLKVPESWEKNKIASLDWFKGKSSEHS